jgi:hypothetical protein
MELPELEDLRPKKKARQLAGEPSNPITISISGTSLADWTEGLS